MLSVVESAEILQVTPTRGAGAHRTRSIAGAEVGRTWTLREEDVMQRAATRPSAGRPRKADVPSLQTTASRTQQQASSIAHAKTIWQRARALPR